MVRYNHLPLLLAPVRDETSLRAAIQAGADAVYFGVGFLNMRASSKGISLVRLKKAVTLAHEHQVKVYITVNVIVYEQELSLLENLLKKLKISGVDAVICWDSAVIKLAKKIGLPIHISTQASIANSQAVLFYKKLGAQCVVLARECNLKQIKAIKQKTKMKIEVFVHGAMCVSISGRCFLSQSLYGKSANRGECQQPCRREYLIIDQQTKKELIVGCGYVLSPKDLCTLPILQELVATGVDVLKIEGRGRSTDYIYEVVAAYRQALDAIKKNKYSAVLQQQLMKQVEQVYNRHFSTGFFVAKPGAEAWSNSSGNQAKQQREYVGMVTHYYPKKQIVQIQIANPVQTGNKLHIQGSTTGLVELILPEFWLNNQAVNTAKNRDEITFVSAQRFRKNDVVYKLK
ncbi:MAG: peptidase U32 family protein [Patescibacteria group bacterium]|jgi:putative protease